MNREDFMAIVYNELATDSDNLRANRIIEAFDSNTVQNGYWKSSDFIAGLLTCSQCGVQRNPHFKLGLGSWNYCPNCGAKMKLAEGR